MWQDGKSVRVEKASLFGSCRLTICLMNGLGCMMIYLIRANISLSMVCMVKRRVTSRNSTSWPVDGANVSQWQNNATVLGDDFCNSTTASSALNSSSSSSSSYQGEFVWTRSFQGHVLSSYFYGYLSMIFLGGWLAGRYGAKHVINTGLFISGVATLLIPGAVRLNDYLIIVLRVIIGASSAMFFSAMMSLGGLWYTPHERSILTSISVNGGTIGLMIVYVMSAQFCSMSHVDNGWPLTFYVTGGAQLLFCIPWMFLVYSSPDQHPRISHREREYIAASTAIKTSIAQRSPFPWLKAVTSPAVLAVLVAMVSNTWYMYTVMTSVPLYFRDVLQFDIKQNGMWLVLPHVVTLVASMPLGFLADSLIRRHILRTVVVRKLYQTLASVGCATMLLIVSVMDYDRRYVAAGLLTASNFFLSMCRSGYLVNFIDIAPRYSGEIAGMSNTFATLSGILAPMTVGYLTTNGTKQEWQNVFYISASIFIFGGLVFLIFAKGTVLPWATNAADIKAQAKSENSATVEFVMEKTQIDTAAIVAKTN